MTGWRLSCPEHNCSEYLSLESFFLLLHQSCAQCRHYPWTFSAKFLFSSSLFMSSRQGSLYPLNTACISDQCSQVKDEGICPGNVPRFYFDQSAKRCLLFSYGGCGGNTNNFLTEESCIGTCGGPSGALIHAIQLHGKHQHSDITFTRSLGISFIQLLQRLVMKIANSSCKVTDYMIVSGGFKPRKPICNLPINRGSCQAKLRRFYFDSADETCKLFVFGGCQGELEQEGSCNLLPHYCTPHHTAIITNNNMHHYTREKEKLFSHQQMIYERAICNDFHNCKNFQC